MSDDKKSLTLKSLKKETDEWKADKDEEIEFMNERVSNLDDCMDEVVQTIDDINKKIDSNTSGIRSIECSMGTISAARPVSKEELEALQKKMEEIFGKMARVEKVQNMEYDARMDLLAQHVEVADKVTYLKEESHRTSTLLGIVAAIGMGLGLVMTALYMGLM